MPDVTNDRPDGVESKFPLGQAVIISTALATLPARDIADALNWHRRGDWGKGGRDHWRANERVLKQGKRLFAARGLLILRRSSRAPVD